MGRARWFRYNPAILPTIMPATPASARANPAPPARAKRIARLLGMILVAGFALFCMLLLALRYVVLPQIPAHRGDIAELLSRRIGTPVEIDALAAGWDGWNPKLVIDGFRVRDRANERAVLELPHVELVTAWVSVPLLQLRLKQLSIERPMLAIRRDTHGRFHVAGLEIDPDASGDQSPFVQWLLRQRDIVVRDATVTWNDETRAAPTLELADVQLRFENTLDHHRFAATGVPPEALASPLDLRGDLSGASFADWHAASGDVYLRLDYADVAAWRAWVPLPVDIESGLGALRLWFKFANGVATGVIADVELADVKARVKPDLPELQLQHVVGRMQWWADGSRRAVSGQGISFTTQVGSVHAPTDFSVDVDAGASEADAHGEATFTRIDLAPLAEVASQLPFPAAWRRLLAAHDPQGALTNGRYTWQGASEAPLHWNAHATLAEVGAKAHDGWPGLTRLSGSVDGGDQKGAVKLTTRTGALELPGTLSEPVRFERLDGELRWQRDEARTRVEFDDVAFANADAAGAFSGHWQSLPQGPGEIDVKAQLTRANVARVADYLPSSFAPRVRDWLRRALVKGNASNLQMAVQGNLAEFPFLTAKQGTMTLAAHVEGATLDYANGWPQIDGIDANVHIDRSHVRVEGTRGTMLDAVVGHTVADIADIEQGVLTIDGSATGTAATFLQFLRQSPVSGWTGHFADPVQAGGNGVLALKLAIPLHDIPATRADGSFVLAAGSDVAFPGAPPLANVAGKLAFSEKGVVDGSFTADTLGGDARLAMSHADDGLHMNASGSGNFALLRNTWPVAFVDRVSGVSDWRFDATQKDGGLGWIVTSSMQGATIDLPAPFGKHAATAMPLRIEHRAGDASARDTLSIALGDAGRVVVQRRIAGGDAVVDRVLVLAGTAVEQAGDAERPGLWIRAGLESIDVDDWLDVDATTAPAGGAHPDRGPGMELQGIDLAATRLTAVRRRFRDMNVSARRDRGNWQFTLRGRDVDGTASWFAAAPDTPNGRAVVRLARFALPRARDEAKVEGDKADGSAKSHADNHWPELDVVAEKFSSRGHDLGRLQVLAQPNGADWRIDKLDLVNDGGSVAAKGRWHVDATSETTELSTHFEIRDAGVFLTNFGYPGEIRGAPTKVDGTFTWAGAPSDFDYTTLNGTLQLKSGPGQFLKADPGIGKLIGVLSLQALPRRITLDFRDVFSEGFAFDEAIGSVKIVNGVLRTDAFRISGTAAGVSISGEADLARETQSLDVRVQPSLATSVSAGTAGAAMLLLAANPVVAAVVGAGTLLAQKVLQDPIEHMFSYEYRVTGSWSDPIVVRTGANAAATGANAAATGANAASTGAAAATGANAAAAGDAHSGATGPTPP